MFDTRLHLMLQQLPGEPVLLPVMRLISDWGYAPAYGVVILLASAMAHLRQALTLFLAVILMSGTVSLVKYHTDLPRPTDVDSRLLDNGNPHRALVEAGASGGFWHLPTPQAIAVFREQERPRNPGFLSGHTGVTTALCTALLLGFRLRDRRWQWTLLLAVPAVMAFSRLYLGRHFLADVLAGWGTGLVLGLLAWQLVPSPDRPWPASRRWALWLLVFAAGWVAQADPGLPASVPGAMAGIALVLHLLEAWPQRAMAPAGWQHRLARLLVALGAAGVLVAAGQWATNPSDGAPAPLAVMAIVAMGIAGLYVALMAVPVVSTSLEKHH